MDSQTHKLITLKTQKLLRHKAVYFQKKHDTLNLFLIPRLRLMCPLATSMVDLLRWYRVKNLPSDKSSAPGYFLKYFSDSFLRAKRDLSVDCSNNKFMGWWALWCGRKQTEAPRVTLGLAKYEELSDLFATDWHVECLAVLYSHKYRLLWKLLNYTSLGQTNWKSWFVC